MSKSDFSPDPVGTGDANKPLEDAIKYKLSGPGGGTDQIIEELVAEGHGTEQEVTARVAEHQQKQQTAPAPTQDSNLLAEEEVQPLLATAEQVRDNVRATTNTGTPAFGETTMTEPPQFVASNTTRMTDFATEQLSAAGYSVAELPPPALTPGMARSEEVGRSA